MPSSKPVFTINQIINQIDSGQQWQTTEIGFAFVSDISVTDFSPALANTQVSAFSAEQRLAAVLSFELWADLAPLIFTQQSQASAEIKLVNYSDPAQAYAQFPPGGDVAINPASVSNLQLKPGEYGLSTLIHELGHSLGLNHPGNYNAGADGSGPTYRDGAEYEQDSLQYSIMSYFPASATGANHGFNEPSTPMLHDVAVIQSIYGVNTATRTGNTVYGFNNTANRDVFNFSTNSQPVVTIWDAGGIDTLDLSGYSSNSTVDLNDGAFSDVGGLTSNLSIAFNAMIENAIGGAGNDTLTGQESANTLSGGGGNDRLFGAGGNDTIDGGGGSDTAVFSGVLANYEVADLGSGRYRVVGSDGSDTLTGVEFVQFGVAAPIVIASAVSGGDPDPVPSNDGSNDSSSPTAISVPVTIAQTVGTSGDTADYFSFTAAESGTVTVRLTGLSDDIDLGLFNSGQALIDSSTQEGSVDESIVISTVADQFYIVGVIPWETASSEYQLIFATDSNSNPDPDPSADASNVLFGDTVLTLPGAVSQSVGEGLDVEDYFQVTVSTDGLLVAELNNFTKDLDLYLYAANGDIVAASLTGGTDAEKLQYSVRAGEVYYLNVYPFDRSGPSDYTLTSTTETVASVDVDNDNSLEKATVISATAEVSGTVGSANDLVDFYRFTAQKSATITVRLTGLSADLDLEFLGQNGALLSSSESAGFADEVVSFYIEAGEDYFVKVLPWDSAESVYQLSLKVDESDSSGRDAGNDISSASTISLNDSIVQDVGATTDLVDFYRLAINAGGLLKVSLDGLGADLDLILYAANGDELAFSSLPGSQSESINYEVKAGTEVLIAVTPFSGSESSYTLSATVEDVGDSIYEDVIQKVYIAYLGRAADLGGLDYWLGKLGASDGNLQAIISDFSDSPEFTDRYGDLSSGELVDNIFQQQFGRAPDSAGREFYLGLLDSGERTLTTITLNVLDGATQGEDFQIITNKVEAAGYFTELLASNDFVYTGNTQANKVKELFDQITTDRNAGLNFIDEFFSVPENNQAVGLSQAVAPIQASEWIISPYMDVFEQNASEAADPLFAIDWASYDFF